MNSRNYRKLKETLMLINGIEEMRKLSKEELSRLQTEYEKCTKDERERIKKRWKEALDKERL